MVVNEFVDAEEPEDPNAVGTRQIPKQDVHAQPLVALERSGVLELIGTERVFSNLDDALNCARELLGLPYVARPAGALPTVRRDRPPEGS